MKTQACHPSTVACYLIDGARSARCLVFLLAQIRTLTAEGIFWVSAIRVRHDAKNARLEFEMGAMFHLHTVIFQWLTPTYKIIDYVHYRRSPFQLLWVRVCSSLDFETNGRL